MVKLYTVFYNASLLLARPGGFRLLPFAIVRFSTVKLTPVLTLNTPTRLPPLIVITPAPSTVVSVAITLVPVPVLMSIVTGPPQLNVTKPPPARAVFRAASVQLVAVPVPTTRAETC